MTKLNIKFILTIIAITVTSLFLAIAIAALSMISGLKNDIQDLNNKLVQIESKVNQTRQEVDGLENELKNLLIEQSKNYSDAGYEIKSISYNEDRAVIAVYFSLKESPNSGDVKICYGKGTDFNEVLATKIVEGKYVAEFEIVLNFDYEISYSTVLSNVKTENLFNLNLQEKLKNRFFAQADCMYFINNTDETVIAFEVRNNFSRDDNLKIKEGRVEIFDDGVLLKTININEYERDYLKGYEMFSDKQLRLDGVDRNSIEKIKTKITVVDFYGIEYVLWNY